MNAPNAVASPLLRALDSLDPGSHLCLIYETQEEQFAALVPFIRRGLDLGQHCLHIADDNTAAAVLDALRAGGIPVEGALASGALAVTTKQDTYLRHGCFNPEAMIGYLAEGVEASRRAGFSAARLTGEMTWALGKGPGVHRLLEYESKLNHFLPHRPALAICQYNVRRFGPEIIREVLRTHPLVLSPPRSCSSPASRPVR